MAEEGASDGAAQRPAAGGRVAPGKPAPETLRVYAGDWAAFIAWCRGTGLTPMPAAAETVAAYLAHVAINLSHGALARRVAAIAAAHRQRDRPIPTRDPAVKEILRRARVAHAPRRRPPPAPAQLARMALACPGDRAGQRDRALLLLAATSFGGEARRLPASGATRLMRSALLALDAEDIRFAEAGMAIVLRAAPESTDRQTVVVPWDPVRIRCPVRAMEDWLRTSDSRFGPVFRKVDRWGNVEHRRLGTDAIRRILARRAPARTPAKTGRARRQGPTEPRGEAP